MDRNDRSSQTLRKISAPHYPEGQSGASEGRNDPIAAKSQAMRGFADG
jgi:hypothetical protein